MAITYPLAFPSPPSQAGNLGIKSWTIYADKATARSASPLTYREQIYSHPGDRLRLQVQWPVLTAPQMKDIWGWVLALNGAEGTFYFGEDPAWDNDKGHSLGVPVVGASSQTGRTLGTTGWLVSTTQIMKRGDLFSLDNSIYILTKDLDSDGSGNATIDLWPTLRASPNSGASLNISNPQGVFRLDGATQSYSGQVGGTYAITISATEAL